MMTIYDSLKEMKAIIEERDRLKLIVGNYQDIAKRLNSVAGELHTLARDLDPMLSTMQTRTRTDYSDMITELTNLLKAGDQISMNKISQLYPDLPMHQARFLFNKLKALPAVQQRRQHRSIMLYL